MPRRPPAVARVLTQVTATMRANEMVVPGDLVLASVSGGPDSVCLLYSLWYLRRLFRMRLAVVHFDHRLRPDSGKDAAYVGRLCGRLRVPLHVRVAVDAPTRGRSVEAWATAARAAATTDVRRELGAAACAEGHTLDDQAESVLLNLFRGTGLDGLAGIDPVAGADRWIQPLLEVPRADVEAFCRALGLRPRRDPMNEDTRYLRAAIRHRVLPAIERATGRGVAATIARTADTVRADRDELAATTRRAYRDAVVSASGEEVRFDAAVLRSLPEPLARRAIRMAAYRSLPADGPAPWPKTGIDAVLDLARGRPGRRRDLPDGWVARRDRAQVVVTRGEAAG